MRQEILWTFLPLFLITISGCLGQDTTPSSIGSTTTPTPESTEAPIPKISVDIVPRPDWNWEKNISYQVRITVTNLSDIDLQDLEVIFETTNPNLTIVGENAVSQIQGINRFEFAKGQILEKKGNLDKGGSEYQDYFITVSLEEYYAKAESTLIIKVMTKDGRKLFEKAIAITVKKK